MSKLEDASHEPAQSACVLQDNEIDAVSGGITIQEWRVGGNGVGTDIQTGPNGNLFVVSSRPTETVKLLP